MKTQRYPAIHSCEIAEAIVVVSTLVRTVIFQAWLLVQITTIPGQARYAGYAEHTHQASSYARHGVAHAIRKLS